MRGRAKQSGSRATELRGFIFARACRAARVPVIMSARVGSRGARRRDAGHDVAPPIACRHGPAGRAPVTARGPALTHRVHVFPMAYTTWIQLESFIRSEIGMRPHWPIHRTDRLELDLDLSGADASDFMGKFFAHFPVAPGDYTFDRYFRAASFHPLELLAMPFSKKLRRKYDKEPLTVGMLERAIELGVWDARRLATAAD
jgi:hypothetical protein